MGRRPHQPLQTEQISVIKSAQNKLYSCDKCGKEIELSIIDEEIVKRFEKRVTIHDCGNKIVLIS